MASAGGVIVVAAFEVPTVVEALDDVAVVTARCRRSKNCQVLSNDAVIALAENTNAKWLSAIRGSACSQR